MEGSGASGNEEEAPEDVEGLPAPSSSNGNVDTLEKLTPPSPFVCQEEPTTAPTPRACPHHTRPRTARPRRTPPPGQKPAPAPGTRTTLGPVQGTRRLPSRRRQPSSRRSRASPGSPARSSQRHQVMLPIRSLPQRRRKKPGAPPRAPKRSREQNQARAGTATQVPLAAPTKWKRRKTRKRAGKEHFEGKKSCTFVPFRSKCGSVAR